jgi:SAM-dependent methyltransferase
MSAGAQTPPAETRPVGLCPVCAGARFSRLFSVADPLVTSTRLTLERCQGCDLVVLNPRLTERAVEKIQAAKPGRDVAPHEVDERLGTFDNVVASLEASVTRRGSLLELGCNGGFLLEAARRRGWRVVGVELSDADASGARRDFGLTVHETLEAAGPQQFDLIVAWHVLEHTIDPLGFLRNASSLLAPEGIFAIQVPSFDALTTFIDRGMFGSLVCAVHNFYFERDSLTNAISSAGLAVVDVIEEEMTLTATCVRHGRLTYYGASGESKFPAPTDA